jgi:hypothetical protein
LRFPQVTGLVTSSGDLTVVLRSFGALGAQGLRPGRCFGGDVDCTWVDFGRQLRRRSAIRVIVDSPFGDDWRSIWAMSQRAFLTPDVNGATMNTWN